MLTKSSAQYLQRGSLSLLGTRLLLLTLLLLLAPLRADLQASSLRVASEGEVAADTLWAGARLEAIPAWNARTESALARVELARAYFEGDERLEVAFPGVGSAPMHLLGWIDASLAEQRAKELARARERAVPSPEVGSGARVAQWMGARDRALNAEDLADSFKRRLLLGLAALASDHPELAGDGYAAERRGLETRVAHLDARSRGMDDGPERSRLLAELASVQRDLTRLDAVLAAARWRSTVPSAPSPVDPDELAALSDPVKGPSAAAHLEHLRPVLRPEEAEQVDEALLRWLELEALPAARRQAKAPGVEGETPLTLVELTERASRLGQEHGRTVSELASLPELAEGEAPGLRRRVLSVRVEHATVLFDVAEAQVEAAKRSNVEESAARESASKAKQRAEVAREEAAAAAEKATDATGKRIAAALQMVAEGETAAQAVWDATQASEETFAADEARWLAEIMSIEEELAAIHGTAGSIGSSRRARATAAWEKLHRLLTQLRGVSLTSVTGMSAAEGAREASRVATLYQRMELEEVRAFADGLPTGVERTSAHEVLEAWELALTARTDAVEQGRLSAEDHRERSFSALRTLKQLRAGLRQFVPARDRVQTSFLFRDIRLELNLFVPNLRTLLRRRLSAATHLPLLLTDPSELVSVLVGSLWMLVVLFGGLWGRARLPRMVEPAVLRLANQEIQLFQRDFRPLVAPVTVVAVAALDLLVLSLILGPVREHLPELAIVLVVVRIAILFRLIDGAFRLAVAPASELRPVLVGVSADAWPLVARAERLLILWLLIGTLFQYVLGEVIGAEALAWLAAQVFLFAFLGLVIFLLHLAEPHVRTAVAVLVPDGPLKKLLTGGAAAGFFFRAPRAGLGLGLLGALRAWQLLQGNVGEGSMLGSVLNVVNRRRLIQNEEAECFLPLPPATEQRLGKPVTVAAASLLYPSTFEEADAAVAAWVEDRSRGITLVVGDRGQGKHVLVTHWAEKAAAKHDLALRSGRLVGRAVSESTLFVYLARLLQLEGVDDESSFYRAIKKLPPTLFLVEELENAFLRRVGGFAALRALFRTLTASCEEHFWMLSMHAPAWRLIERVGTVVNPNSFRRVIALPRLGGADLQSFLVGRMTDAEFEPDFGPLSNSTAAGQPKAEEARTAEAFFRLLAEASGGNPGVAVPLWTGSLSPPQDTTAPRNQLRVRLPSIISNPQLPPLSDPALLTLAAVRVHGGLTVAEIVQVNNMEPDLVQSTVQVLDNLGLLDRVGGRFRIEMSVLVSVTRLLRRRHFVYGKDVV